MGSGEKLERNRMPDAMSQLLNTPSYCFSAGLMGASEWLAIEAHLLYLDNQLQDSQRQFRERTEVEYNHEKAVIMRKSQDNHSDPREDISILDYYYHEAKDAEERITQRAWLWFLPIVWSSFETQYLSALRTAYRYKYKKDLPTPRDSKVDIVKFFKIQTRDISEEHFCASWDFLENLRIIRNAICHGNGCIEYLDKPKDREAAAAFCKNNENIELIPAISGHDGTTYEGSIVIDSKFAREAFTICRDTTEKLRHHLFPKCYGSDQDL